MLLEVDKKIKRNKCNFFSVEFEFVLPERYNVINVQIVQNTQESVIISVRKYSKVNIPTKSQCVLKCYRC